MGRRFADINRAAELKFAADNYAKYQTDVTSRKSPRITGTGTPKNITSKNVSIQPFSKGTKKLILYIVKRTVSITGGTTPTVRTELGKTTIDNYYDDTPPAEGIEATPKGFAPARANIFQPEANAVASYVKSKYTGLHYPKLAGKRAAYPIGRRRAGGEVSDEFETKTEIKNALIADTAWTDGARISFSPEKPGQV